MSSSGYQEYGGNPYAHSGQASRYGSQSGPHGSQTAAQESQAGGYGSQTTHAGGGYRSQDGRLGSTNPYAASPFEGSRSHVAANPYAQGDAYHVDSHGHLDTHGRDEEFGRVPPQHPEQPRTMSDQTQNSNYSRPMGVPAGQTPLVPGPVLVHQSPTILSNQDFLARVEGTRSDIRQLTANVSEIGAIHQRVLSLTDSSSPAQLENLVAATQVLNTRIKDQIKYLEGDAAKSGKNTTKDSQIRTLKQNFRSQLEEYQREETTYRQRYQEQIARQYRIVNPEATEAEAREAATADWGDEGVFQTALKSNRTGAANSVLGSVRARHNDIQKIERTLIELNQLFQDLAEAVVIQEAAVVQTEGTTHKVKDDTEAGNQHLTKGIKSARNRRKLKWWCLFIVILIIVILGLVLGLVLGLRPKNTGP